MGSSPGGSSLKTKSFSTPKQLSTYSSAGAGPQESVPSPCRGADWLALVQVLFRRPERLCMFRRCYFAVLLSKHCLLQSFRLSFCDVHWGLGIGEYGVDAPCRAVRQSFIQPFKRVLGVNQGKHILTELFPSPLALCWFPWAIFWVCIIWPLHFPYNRADPLF